MRLTICVLIILTTSLQVAEIRAESEGIINLGLISWRHQPPYKWENKITGRMEGFEIALIESLMEKLELEYQWVIFKGNDASLLNSQAFESLARGEIDLYLLPPGVNPGAGSVKVDEPVFNLQVKAYALRSKKLQLTSFDAFRGLRHGILPYAENNQKKDSDEALLSQFPTGISVHIYPTQSAIINALLNNEVDFTLSSVGSLAVYARVLEVQDQLEVFDFPGSIDVPRYLALSLKGSLLEHEDSLSKLLYEFKQQGRSRLLFNNAMKKYVVYHRQLESQEQSRSAQ